MENDRKEQKEKYTRGRWVDDRDEYGNMPPSPSVWSKILRPTLLGRQGWATFIGTPNGPNHFRDRWLVTRSLPKTILPAEKKLIVKEECSHGK